MVKTQLEAATIQMGNGDRKLESGRPPMTHGGTQVEDARGISELHDLVQRIVQESGDPREFDASEWLSRWLGEPHPAVSNMAPSELLQMPHGYEQVRALLSRMQSGAYC
jgi:uncharacterized protein (DUF2384 family)